MKFCLIGLLIGSLFGLGACVSTNDNDSGVGGLYRNSITEMLPPKVGEAHPPAEFVGSESDAMARRSQADYHYAMGEAYSNEGQSEKAIEEFRHTLIYDEDSPVVHLRLAKEYLRIGAMTEALEYAEKAVKLDSKSTDSHFLLGAIYSSMKMYDKARAQYEEVRKIDPANFDAQLYIGALLAEEGKYDKAVQFFEDLANNKKFANAHLAWYYVGRIRMQQNTSKTLDQAEKAFEKSLSLKPEFVDAVLALAGLYQSRNKSQRALKLLSSFQDHYGPNAAVAEALAPLYLEIERYDLAYKQFEISAQSDPDDLNILMKMAHILFVQKKYDASIAQLEKLLASVPDSDRVRYFLAAVYMEKGNFDAAIKNFAKVPPESPLYFQAIVLQAHSHRMLKQNNKAIDILKNALNIRKDVPQFYSSLAALLSESKEYEQAVAVVKEGIDRFPSNTDLRFLLGTIYDKTGQINLTIEEMNKVLEINPDHAQALNYVAYTYAEQGRLLEQAEAMARRATEIEPDDGYIMDTLGWVLFKQGKIGDSIKTLEAAIKLKHDESIIAEHLGDAYYKNQMINKARRMYQRALELEKNEEQAAKIRAKLLAIDNPEFKSRVPASHKSK